MRKVSILSLVFIIVAMVIVSCGQKQVQEPLTEAPFFTTLEEGKQAASADKPILVDFYTDWCTWCKKLNSEVFTDSAVIDYFVNNVVLVKINAELDSATTKAYNVSGYPTLVLVDKDGNEIDRIVGYLPADEFVQKVDDYQNGVGTLEDLLGQAEGASDRELFLEIADKYKYRGAPDDAKIWFEKVIAEGDPADSLSGESRMSLADMLRRAKDYAGARDAFAKIAKDFKGTSFAEGADIWTAIVYRQEGDTAKAIAAFEKFIEVYPQSEDIEYAAEQIKKLKGIKEEETN